jgi:hypothetical protein
MLKELHAAIRHTALQSTLTAHGNDGSRQRGSGKTITRRKHKLVRRFVLTQVVVLIVDVGG